MKALMGAEPKGYYYSGTSGLVLPVPNKQFYPAQLQTKSRLCYYGSLFNSIEINSSFYKLPLRTTLAKWAADTPEDFRFTFKVFREITHNRDLAFQPDTLSQFMELVSAVGDKRGCLLVQFPPSSRFIHFRQLELLLKGIRRSDPQNSWKVALEFRHQSWYQQATYDLLEDYRMSPVLHDKLQQGGYMLDSDCDFVYIRFHGPAGDYRGCYADEFLQEYAAYIRNWLAEGKLVYTYFNNTMGSAIKNLQTLRTYVMANASI